MNKNISQYKLPEYFFKIAKFYSNEPVFLRIMIEKKTLVMMSLGYIDLDTRIEYEPELESFTEFNAIPDIKSDDTITNNKKFKDFYKECFDTVDGIETFSVNKCYKAILKYFDVIAKYNKYMRDIVIADYKKIQSEDYKQFNFIFVKYVKKLKKEFDPSIAADLRFMASENILSALQLSRYNWLIKHGKLNGEQ